MAKWQKFKGNKDPFSLIILFLAGAEPPPWGHHLQGILVMWLATLECSEAPIWLSGHQLTTSPCWTFCYFFIVVYKEAKNYWHKVKLTFTEHTLNFLTNLLDCPYRQPCCLCNSKLDGQSLGPVSVQALVVSCWQPLQDPLHSISPHMSPFNQAPDTDVILQELTERPRSKLLRFHYWERHIARKNVGHVNFDVWRYFKHKRLLIRFFSLYYKPRTLQ